MNVIANIVLFASVSVAAYGAEPTYIVIPLHLKISSEELARSHQKIRKCEVLEAIACESEEHVDIFGPLSIEHVRDLLLFAGLKQKPISGVRTDGRVAEVIWSTAGGMKIELYEREDGKWKYVWTHDVAY